MTREMEPSHTDVMSGRGVSTNKYPGNENFRKIIMEQMVSISTYMTITTAFVITVNLTLTPWI